MEADVEGPDLGVQGRAAVLHPPLRPGAGLLYDHLVGEGDLQPREERAVGEEVEEYLARDASLVAGDGDVSQ